MKYLIFPAIIFAMTISATAAELEKVIAHRGASFDAPENTHAAIELAIKHQAGIIEFDVRETADGKLYLFHDKGLKRLCGKEGLFSDLKSDAVAGLDVGSWFTKGDFPDEKPITLKAAIELCLAGGAVPLIEHKTGTAEAYAAVIKDLGVIDQVIVQSFNWDFIKAIKTMLPALKIGALGKDKLTDFQQQLLEIKPDWVGWSHKDIRESDVEWLKTNGFHVAVWTVNGAERAKYLIGIGVDKIITDRPKYIESKL